MNLNRGCITDKGNYRNKNQDRIMCSRKMTDDSVLVVACVCDGIGSFAESEIAADMMITGISNWFDQIVKYYPKVINKDNLVEDLEITIRELNELVCEYRENKHVNIGCTMSLLLMMDLEYFIFHVGDSKVYCLRDSLFQMTRDEVVLKQIDGKEKLALVNYIGKSRQLCINRQNGCAEQNDVYIVGSDGLCKKLLYDDVCDLFQCPRKDIEIEEICQGLAALVMDRGEKDNISCAIIQVTE